jgi:hypothetical protein
MSMSRRSSTPRPRRTGRAGLAAVAALAITALAGCASGSVDGSEARLIDTYDPVAMTPPGAGGWASITDDRPETLALLATVGNGYLRQPELTGYLNDVLNKLIAAGPVPEVPAQVYVLDDRFQNAFATPDGAIFVSMGMLRELKSEDELAALLAHELTHVIYQHGRADWWIDAQKQLISVQNIASDVVDEAEGDEGEEAEEDVDRLTLMSETAHFMSETVIAPSYTREQEDQGDLMAVDLLVRAGYNRDAMNAVVNVLASAQENLRERRRLSERRLVSALQQQVGIEDERVQNVIDEVGRDFTDFWREIFGEDHRSADERREQLFEYAMAHYRGPVAPTTALPWRAAENANASDSAFTTRRDARRIAAVFANYAAAIEADRLLADGELDAAEREARKGVRSPTEHAPFPRLVFYQVRKEQGRQDLAWRNLEIALEDRQPSVVIYQKAIQEAAAAGRIEAAMAVSDKAKAEADDPVTLWPWRIWLLAKTGQEREAVELQAECRLKFPGELEDACRYGPEDSRT